MGKVETAELQKLNVQKVSVKIKGLSPLIMHRWDEKAKQQMLDKQMKKTVKKEAKDPKAQYESSIYKLDDGRLGFPSDAFKAAMVRGADLLGGKTIGMAMNRMRMGFFVHGEYGTKDDRDLVPISGKISMREDMVRLNGTTSDIRYRGQIQNWSAEIKISYNGSVVSFDQLVNMLNVAGYGVGVGEWRPERNGMFGRFEVIN